MGKLCNNCIHKDVCARFAATWGVRNCGNFMEKPKKGRWIMHNSGSNNWVECSECNTVGSPFWKCCPVCEAKMVLPTITDQTMKALEAMDRKAHGGE